MKNTLNFSEDYTSKISLELNELLSNFQLYYQNLRGFHWNVKGPHFFELHAQFEAFYNDAALKVDEIAERILALGGQPLHSFSKYKEIAQIKELENISEGSACVQATADAIKILLEKERGILSLAGDADDEGTADLITPIIQEQEKTLWMLRAWLG